MMVVILLFGVGLFYYTFLSFELDGGEKKNYFVALSTISSFSFYFFFFSDVFGQRSVENQWSRNGGSGYSGTSD